MESETIKKPNRTRLGVQYFYHTFGVPFSNDVMPSTLFLKNNNYLVIDVETQHLADEVGGWDHLDRLKVSVACAYDSAKNEYLSFQEHELPQLFDLCYQRLVIGYNIKKFDLPVLAPYGLKIGRLDTFDLMLDVENQSRMRFVSLESLAQPTLGVGKSADGILAVEWFKSGQMEKIIEYCLQDVKVTKELFEFGRENGFVLHSKNNSEPKKIAVVWQ